MRASRRKLRPNDDDPAAESNMRTFLRQRPSEARRFAQGLEARFSAGTHLYNTLGSNGASGRSRSLLGKQPHSTSSTSVSYTVTSGPASSKGLPVSPAGPLKLRITGIEFPQPGFRPPECVQKTGRCLTTYCKSFNVPFEYSVIAKKWETVKLKELKTNKDEELMVLNCLYLMKNLPDETVVEDCPQDSLLNLIRRINPDLFIHLLVNGTHNAPFFLTRFREALFHFSALFTMFEASLTREDPHRLMFKKEVFGRDVMNVVACEGLQRVERPETYRQWQVRNVRAGFEQVGLDKELLRTVKNTVRNNYHKNFVVDEDGMWMLQGWKGRIFHAISCWRPV